MQIYIEFFIAVILFVIFRNNKTANGWLAIGYFGVNRLLGGDIEGLASLVFFLNYIGLYRKEKKQKETQNANKSR